MADVPLVKESLLTTKGDLFVFDGTDLIRVGVGTDDHVLTADAAESAGLKWAAASGGGGSSTEGGVIAYHTYERGVDGSMATTATSVASDIDATNAAITFTVPASGAVLVQMSMVVRNDTAGGGVALNLRDGSGDITGTRQEVWRAASNTNPERMRPNYMAVLEGLTPDASLTLKAGFARSSLSASGDVGVFSGPGHGPLVMIVSALP